MTNIVARFDHRKGDFNLKVDLSVPSQGITALFGPSGCGKTTLLRLIAGLEKDTRGHLSIGDMCWQKDEQFVATHQRPLGYVFQDASLFNHLNVKQNIEYGQNRISPQDRKISLIKAIDLLELGALLNRKPESLSGGEKQRVAIARAIAVSPKLLLMDEPLAALDQNRKKEVLPYIETLQKEFQIPVIYVSHSVEEVAQLADHMILMGSGKVVATGKIHELFTRLDLPLAHELDASSIISATVSSYDEQYQLASLKFAAGTMTVGGPKLKEGKTVRLRLGARDVSLTLEHQTNTSILNIFPVVIDEIIEEGNSQVTVRLLAEGVPLLSRITRKSASELKLQKGKPVYAQVKSVALLN